MCLCCDMCVYNCILHSPLLFHSTSLPPSISVSPHERLERLENGSQTNSARPCFPSTPSNRVLYILNTLTMPPSKLDRPHHSRTSNSPPRFTTKTVADSYTFCPYLLLTESVPFLPWKRNSTYRRIGILAIQPVAG